MIKELLFNKRIGEAWDKMQPNIDEAINFAHEHINPEPQREIAPYKYSLEYCLAHSGDTINDRFRQDRPEDIDLQIAEMLSKNRTDTDIVVYRGVWEGVYKKMIENATPDCDLYEKAFLSTSLLKGHEIPHKIRLRIFVPSGTRCKYLGNVNYEQHFYEVAIMHSAKLKIISRDSEYINCKLISTL